MNRKQIEEFISLVAPDYAILLADNLDKAFVGIDSENETPRAVYSIEKCIEVLSEDMSSEEAVDYFWFNVAGSGGKGYPIYISTPPDDQEESPYK
tara:strand:- start:81 stop:365 length:285 start_codon:yes stop_codon:yes gene_type:complete